MLAFVNAFLCGAIFMLLLLAFNPEMVAFIRKVCYWPYSDVKAVQYETFLDAYRTQLEAIIEKMRRIIAIGDAFARNQYDMACAVNDLQEELSNNYVVSKDINDLINIMHDYLYDYKNNIEQLDMMTKQYEE